METLHESCKYTFTPHELVDIAREQARKHSDKARAEEEFESVKSGYKNRISRIESDISDCTRRVSFGYEMRTVECVVLKFRPDNDHSTMIRTDSGKVVRMRRLSSAEKQQPLIPDGEEAPQFTHEATVEFDEGGNDPIVVALYPDEAEYLNPVLAVRPIGIRE